jgi:hypothetical protein
MFTYLYEYVLVNISTKCCILLHTSIYFMFYKQVMVSRRKKHAYTNSKNKFFFTTYNYTGQHLIFSLYADLQ